MLPTVSNKVRNGLEKFLFESFTEWPGRVYCFINFLVGFVAESKAPCIISYFFRNGPNNVLPEPFTQRPGRVYLVIALFVGFAAELRSPCKMLCLFSDMDRNIFCLSRLRSGVAS